jgi:hypothetical protein
MFLGELNQSEAIRLTLTLDTTPTGTPQIGIDKQGVEVLAETNMSGSGLEWYYNYTTGAGATIGAYQVRYSAVISGTNRYAYDSYNISVNSVDDVKAETASIQTDTTSIESKVDIVDTNIDQLLIDVAAVPTVGEIDTELTSTHGAGLWNAGGGTGAYNATIHVQDGSAVDVPDAYVTIHNATDDDSPIVASGTTDINGDVVLNLDGNVYVRVSKAGFNFTSTAKNITATGTYTVSGTTISYSNPSDPDVCRLFLFPKTLDNQDITDLASDIKISSKTALTKVDGIFIHNSSDTFTYNAATDPDSYYFDAVRTSNVHISSDLLGIDADVLVPDAASVDLDTLIS